MAESASSIRRHSRKKEVLPPCIVCGGATTHLRAWTKSDIRHAYASITAAPFPNETPLADYKIIRCRVCGLIFADPQVAGSAAFYDWIASVRNYYPADRWEWGKVANMLSAFSRARLLEIGCGTGNFLDYISSRLNIDAEGLDINREAVATCKARGLRAHNIRLESFAQDYSGTGFDFVCAYHCLEHIENPKAFVASMEKILAPNGRIILSVPYSPTSLEILDWDCLNLPPHHITRWNKTSLSVLSASTGMAIELETDERASGHSFGIRLVLWKFIALSGGARGAIADLARPFLHPLRFLKVALFLVGRERIRGKLAGDTALVILRRN